MHGGGCGAGLRRPRLGLAPLRLLLPHESVVWPRAVEVLEWIIAEGAVLRPILATPAPGGRLVILDGHHRWTALRLLGARLAPVLVVDYWRHVDLGSWRPGVTVSRREVLEAAASGRLFPPKTTRHRLKVEVDWDPVPLEALVPGAVKDGAGPRGRAGGPGCPRTRAGRRGSGRALLGG